MKSAELHHFRRTLAGALLTLLCAALIPFVPPVSGQSTDPLGKTKSMAETQHEIVMLLLKKKEFEKAAIEANKIFEMKWPESQEPLLLKELMILSDQFLRQGQPMLGLQIIDRNSKCFKKASSQVEILKETGYLYKSLNQNDKALECFRKARELENRN